MQKRRKRLWLWSASLGIFAAAISCGDNDNENEGEQNQPDPCLTDPARPTKLFEIADVLTDAVAGQGDPANTKIAIVPPYMTAFWSAPQTGAIKAGTELGVVVGFNFPPDDPTGQAQKDLIDGYVSGQTYDAIGVAPRKADVMQPPIDAAIAAGIPVITLDSDASSSQRYLYLGTDNEAAGRAAGEEMVELLGGSGTVALFLSSQTDANLMARKAGIEAAFAGTGVSLLTDDYSHGGGSHMDVLEEKLNQALDDHPDLGGMISINGHIAPLLADVLVQRGKQGTVKAVVFDLSTDVQNDLAADNIQAVVVQQSYFEGYLSVYVLYAMKTLGVETTMSLLNPYLAGEAIDTGVTVLTADSLDDYQSYLAECLELSGS